MREESERFSAAFAALGDEVRVEILEAVVEARAETPRDPGVSFSELRERVGVADSGRFNYHLGKLRGRFLAEADGEYELTYAGREVVGAILAGTPDPDLELAPEPLADDCPLCDAAMTAWYDNGDVVVECENEHTPLQTTVPPAAASGRSVPELLEVAARVTFGKMEHLTADVCFECFGHLDRRVEPFGDEIDLEYAFKTVCERCGMMTTSALAATILRHPAFVALCHEHGIAVRDCLPWQIPGFVDGDTERVSEDPDRYRVRVEIEGDEMTFRLDDSGRVLETERNREGPDAET
jgi:DNA-binding transcriptional ArsR family regulator